MRHWGHAIAPFSAAAFGLSALAPVRSVTAQEIVMVDSSFTASVTGPDFRPGSGPRILMDEAHHNLYTNPGYYHALTQLLVADGYRVTPLRRALTTSALAAANLLVMANVLPVADQAAADTLGPGISEAELGALLRWIRSGGSLLLLVDHRPYAHAVAPLLDSLGLHFTDGYALDYQTWDPLIFRRADGTLLGNPVSNGRNVRERVDSIATFDGDAFRADGSGVIPLIRFRQGIESLQPKKLWAIGDDTPRIDVSGWLQGAALTLGRGRVIVFGESGLAVAQFVGPKRQPRGMNAPFASRNAQFLLNAVHWLTRVIP